MNNFTLVGRVAGTPEKFETAAGLKYCRIRISSERNVPDQEETDETYEVTVFRNLAEEDYQIGQILAISGRIQANNYEKEGNLYFNTKLIGNSVSLISA